MSGLTSSQVERTNPPRPRLVLYSAALAGSSTMEAQASTGSFFSASASRQSLSNRPRTIGYFTRLALYRYQLYDAPRWQPRGS